MVYFLFDSFSILNLDYFIRKIKHILLSCDIREVLKIEQNIRIHRTSKSHDHWQLGSKFRRGVTKNQLLFLKAEFD